jgi:DNA-binding LacI/PurR family transcriptional regulator/DNA-binding transcriptional regulator YhcF (GntR family)
MTVRNEQFRILVDELQRQVHATFAPGERLPSRRDLAAMYGVGATTIDRALKSLSKHGFVRPATRVGWFRAADDSAGSGSPQKASALRVGIMSRLTREEWDHAKLYGALLKEARRRGVTIVEVPNPHRRRPTPGRCRIQLSRVPWNTFDIGLLLDAEDTIVADSSALKQRRVLCVDYDATRLGLDSVAFDDGGVGALAARYLLELGHVRFGLTEDLNDPGFAADPNILARRLGFEAEIGRRGGVIMPEWRVMIQRRVWKTRRVDYVTAAAGRWAMAPLNERPTALFSTTTGLDKLVRELERHNISVPTDLSVMQVSVEGNEPTVNGISVTRVDLKLDSLASRTFDVIAELAAESTRPAALPKRPPKLALAPALLVPGRSTATPPC